MDETSPAATVAEAPATFSVEQAFKEASAAIDAPKAETPETPAPDSGAPADASKPETAAQPSGEEPKSNRQLGKEAYERGLREGREAAEREVQARVERERAEQSQTRQRQELDDLLRDASLPDDGTFDTQARRQAAQQKLGQLTAQNAVVQSAAQRARQEYEREFWGNFQGNLGDLGFDAEGTKALMTAPSASDFAKRLVEHGKAQEKAVWEPEIAKRDATIAELRGKLASRSSSPEAANGLRVNGASIGEIKTLEDAYRAAQALHAGS